MSRSISRTAAQAVAATWLFGAVPASAHHAGGVGNALGAGPIVTISADTLDQDHSVAAVTLDYQSLERLEHRDASERDGRHAARLSRKQQRARSAHHPGVRDLLRLWRDQ